MSLPFPGMDPYLEGSEWTSVHHELSSEIARTLAPKVRPKYIVRTEPRFVIEIFDDVGLVERTNVYTDVSVAETASEYAVADTQTAAGRPLQLATIVPEPTKVPHVTVEIRDVERRELVTAIEVISPTNKRGEGYHQYLEKRRRVLESTTHLLEIDLLRAGRRVPMRDPLPDAPYFVFLSRAETRSVLDVWPIRLQDRLPAVPIPLLPGDEDVTLDLQAVLDRTYDAFGYDLSLDYTRPVPGSLSEEDAAWLQQVLDATDSRLVEE